MYGISFSRSRLGQLNKEDTEYVFSETVNQHVEQIRHDLCVFMLKKGWLTENGRILVTEGREHIGSNIYTSNLDTLYTDTEDTNSVMLDVEMVERFEDNHDVASFTDLLNFQKILRVKWGDKILEAYVARILNTYFSDSTISQKLLMNPLFETTFINGWWLIYALQNTMLSLDVSLS